MNSFYLTLHSHGDSHIQMANNVHSFNIHLGKKLDLPGKWEVGLVQILYPMTMTGIKHPYSIFQVLQGDEKTSFKFQTKNYYDDVGLVHELCHFLKGMDISVYHVAGHIHIENNSNKECEFFFHPKILDILGTDSIKFTKNKFKAMDAVNVNRGVPQQLFVHTDIINYQMVNNGFDNLLRVVPTNINAYKYGCAQEHSFQQIQYLPVARDVIDSVAVYIKDSVGEDVSFEYGTLTVVLHFRQRHD